MYDTHTILTIHTHINTHNHLDCFRWHGLWLIHKPIKRYTLTSLPTIHWTVSGGMVYGGYTNHSNDTHSRHYPQSFGLFQVAWFMVDTQTILTIHTSLPTLHSTVSCGMLYV